MRCLRHLFASPAVVLSRAVLPEQHREGVRRVAEHLTVVLVQHQCLHLPHRSILVRKHHSGACWLYPLERCEDRLRAASQEGRQRKRRSAGQASVDTQQLSILLVRPEHEGSAGRLLQQRGQDPPVELKQALGPQLTERLPGGDAVQLLPEHRLVNGEGETYVGEACGKTRCILPPLMRAGRGRRVSPPGSPRAPARPALPARPITNHHPPPQPQGSSLQHHRSRRALCKNNTELISFIPNARSCSWSNE